MNSIAQGLEGADLGSCSMAFVTGEGCKKMVLSSAAKKWKDFKYNVTRQYILPFAHDKEKLKEPPELYKFIEKSQWDAFVASRLSPDFEAVHSEQKQRREKLEYNHRLSRKGYVGLEDQLVETMPDIEEIDRAVLWKKAREDKTGNIPDPKVAEKAKIIVSLTNSVLNLKNIVFYFGIDVARLNNRRYKINTTTVFIYRHLKMNRTSIFE